MATSNRSTAIRDKILASLARYRALRIGKFPCAFWRLSSRPGLTAEVLIPRVTDTNTGIGYSVILQYHAATNENTQAWFDVLSIVEIQ